MLDQELQRQPRELARILVHELFHFAWVRLGNPARRSYEALVREEWKQRARGELGWSAESRKRVLLKSSPIVASKPITPSPGATTFAKVFATPPPGSTRECARHPEYTLAARHRNRRAEWFRGCVSGERAIPI